MNPHAIPSRMTIAQNLEQLMGKTAALSGAIGDGTSFMNDGSPQDAIGFLLENMGFEKHGNEVLYNGATGEQIKATIFIGPVYGMRLKHMVEDKWQARGQGRREMRTHQPTGGRGAQGGLKIGEMDRDAIIAHAGMAFVKESFMERSDGAKIPICVACGTIPIYNARLNINICPLCDGPLKYIGDTVHNMELLPPLGRPKSKIVEVEIPYSTKLLTQEQETYMNLTMRYITTSGVQRLTPLEFSGKASESIKELPQLILPETVVPAYMEEVEKATLTVEQLRSMGASVDQLTMQERATLDTIVEEDIEGEGINVAPPQMIQLDQGPQMGEMEQNPENQIIYPPEQPMMGGGMSSIGGMSSMGGMQSMGGMLPPSFPSMRASNEMDDHMMSNPVPGGGAMIVVRTDAGAMAEEGLLDTMGPMGPMGGRRPPRRNPYSNMGGGYMRPPPSMPMQMSGEAPPPGGMANARISITKLE